MTRVWNQKRRFMEKICAENAYIASDPQPSCESDALKLLPKRRLAGDLLTDHQAVNVFGSLVSVDGFKVHHVADDRIFVDDPVGAEHIPRFPCDFQGQFAIVHL